MCKKGGHGRQTRYANIFATGFILRGAMLSFLQIIRLEGDMLLQLSSIFSSSKQLNLSRGGGARQRKYNGLKNILGSHLNCFQDKNFQADIFFH